MTLMFISYVTWTVLYFMEVDPVIQIYKDAYELVDGLFAFGMILSFFRLVYLMQISSYLGILQLCLSQMIQVRSRKIYVIWLFNIFEFCFI